jgi:hypothetical protein
MIVTYMIINFLLFVAVTIPMVVSDGMFVTHCRKYYPEAWEDLGKPGFLVDPKTSQKIRNFLRRGGDHPMLQDPNIKRLAVMQDLLDPIQTFLLFTFVGLFIWLLIS